jgi:Fur family ferric uptake transcriptional regulator
VVRQPVEPGRTRGRALLRAHGLRCTAPRLAVLDVLAAEAAPGHLSAAQIHRRLEESGQDIVVSTVYRTLGTLAELGVLHTLALSEQALTYGLVEDAHHHAICRFCGRLTQIPAAQLRAALAEASHSSDFELADQGSLTLHGACPDCRASGAAGQRPSRSPSVSR